MIRVKEIIRSQPKDSAAVRVIQEVRAAIADQRKDARAEAFGEVELWLGPILEQLERETLARRERR
jgi:hypothetical protein